MFRLLSILISLSVVACTGDRPDRPNFGRKSEDVIPNGPGGDPQPEIPEYVDPQGKPIVLELVNDRSAVRMISFSTLLNKFKAVTDLADTSEPVKLAVKLSQSLGGYNFAAGVQPENKWSNEKMSAWLQVTDLACRDKALIAKITASGGAKSFVESVYGRDASDEELAMISDLDANKKIAADRKARVFCTAVLSSGEFVSL